MKKFKDLNGKVYEIEKGFEHMLPESCVEIDQAEFDVLTAPVPLTAQEINAGKDAQVEAELGGDNIRVLVETFIEIVNDGSIATDTVGNVLVKAKAKRRAELDA